jgi:hypothetical protein
MEAIHLVLWFGTSMPLGAVGMTEFDFARFGSM